jgi:excisionase family DNA binding protein
MLLSIKEVAGILEVSEKSVRNLIASGKLAAERVGRRVLVRKDLLESLLAGSRVGGSTFVGSDILNNCGDDSSTSKGLEMVMDRLTILEKQVQDLASLIRENNDHFHELREKDALLAQKEVELEKLRRDILYQQRICEKEIEHCRKHHDEQCALSREEFAEKLALERHYLEEKLAVENAIWSERLAREQESFNLKLLEIKEREGLWAKLVKMMTWS